MRLEAVARRPASRSAAVLCATLTLAGCASGSLRVESDYDAGWDFDAYSTYAWSTPRGELTRSPVVDDSTDVRVRRAVDAELARAGLERTALVEAELTVGYLARVDRLLDGPRPSDDAEASAPDGFTPRVSDRVFESGTLEIGLVDVGINRVVWRGLARADLDPTKSIEQRQQRIDQAVREILKRFPGR